MRILAFALHLLGARRKEVAALVEMPEESVKTLLRLVLRDGFAAVRDRRLSAAPPVGVAPQSPPRISAHRDQEGWIVELATEGETLSIPATHPVQAQCRSTFGATVRFGIGNFRRALSRAGP